MRSSGEVDRAIAERLGDCGLRYTAARRSIVHGLRAAGPMTLPELLSQTTEIAQSSAYRNLSQLEQAGVVRRLVHDHDHARYELSEAFSDHHHHLICERCGEVRDVTLDVSAEQAVDLSCQAIATQEGFTVRQHVIDLYGLCGNCNT